MISCKKKVTSIYPEIIGNWSGAPSHIDPCTYYSLTVKKNGKAIRSSGNDAIGELNYQKGIARIEENDLYIGGEFAFTIGEIKDSIGSLGPYNQLCTSDVYVSFSKVIKSATGQVLYYRFD